MPARSFACVRVEAQYCTSHVPPARSTFFLLFFSTCKYSKLSYEMSHWHIVVRRYQKPPNHAYQARYHAIPHPTYGLQLEQELGAN